MWFLNPAYPCISAPYWSERVFTALLVNPTPQPIHFVAHDAPPPEGDSAGSGDMDSETSGVGEGPSADPRPRDDRRLSHGTIAPFGKSKVTFRFAPPPVLDCKTELSGDRVRDELGDELTQTALLEVIEIGQQIRVPMTGFVRFAF